MQPANRGLVSVDILRGLAAGGVFYYHQHIGVLLAKFTGFSFLGYTDLFGAQCAVPLFFLLSGFCIHLPNIKYLKENKPLPFKQYLTRRFLRIYPPYFAALVLSILTNYLIEPHYTLIGADLLSHLFLFQGFTEKYFNTINVVLWTISVEFALYLLYPAFYYIRLKTTLKKTLGFIFIISLVSVSVFEYLGLNSVVALFFVTSLWFSWCCGAFIAESMVLTPGELKKPVYKIFYALILIAFFLSDKGIFSLAKFPLMIIAWAGPLLLFVYFEGKLSASRSIIIKLLTCIGLSSYSLYLFHDPLINLKNYLAHLLPTRLQMPGLIIGIFLIPLFTWFTYLCIEKPFMRKKMATLK